jgi:1-pyrroline-5-carboxylate dehydrogenase
MRGERNYLVYIPLGVGVVVPPWNFPCAIMAGIVVASLVTGNTVVVKPAADSPTIAAKFIDILFEAGVPKEAVNFITGPGSVIGDVLVQHPKTRYIGFTGSKEVGLRISELAAKAAPGQIWIKRTVLEMGGKDAIVVDDEADIDAAVEGTATAAFGYQGQKCSACSRAIVSEKVYDSFVQKLVDRTKKITVGPSDDPNNYMGPVISSSAMKTILDRSWQERRQAAHGRKARRRRRLLHRTHHYRGRGSQSAPRAGRSLRPRPRGDQSEKLRPRTGNRQQHRIRPHRRSLFQES